jgi:hypothetical protein
MATTTGGVTNICVGQATTGAMPAAARGDHDRRLGIQDPPLISM